MFCWKAKTRQSIVGVIKNGFRPVSVQTGKVFKTLEMHVLIHLKIEQNQIKIRARKSDAKMMKTMLKMHPKGNQFFKE